jgi:hypothetical protein
MAHPVTAKICDRLDPEDRGHVRGRVPHSGGGDRVDTWIWRRSDAVARTHEGLFRPDADLPEEQAAYDKHVEETYTPEWFKTATRID